MIFVFGSNMAGRHGKGAALYARNFKGAVYGQAVGRQGDSYAIPTKDENLRRLSLARIHAHILDFITYANAHPHEVFELTPIGCGLAGYSYEEIAPMFRRAPPNVVVPDEFKRVLGGLT
jgi:hypothetical protein